MQAKKQVNADQPFLKQTILDRPLALWLIWVLGGVAWLCILFAMIIDEIGYVTFTLASSPTFTSNSLIPCTCGFETYTCQTAGFNKVKYQTVETNNVLQTQAGSAWLGLLITSLVFSLMCCFGTVKDYFAGSYDSYKPNDICGNVPLCGNWGFSTMGSVITMFFAMVGLFAYVGQEKCTTEAFWNVVFTGSVQSLSGFGGMSIALVSISLVLFILSYVLIFYSIRAYGTVPGGAKKDIPVNIPKPKNNKPPPKANDGQAPKSNIFRPNNVVNNNNNNNRNNLDKKRDPIEEKSPNPSPGPPAVRPNAPPPKPMKPKLPPPVPQ